MSGSTVIPPRPLQHPSHHLKTFRLSLRDHGPGYGKRSLTRFPGHTGTEARIVSSTAQLCQ